MNSSKAQNEFTYVPTGPLNEASPKGEAEFSGIGAAKYEQKNHR